MSNKNSLNSNPAWLVNAVIAALMTVGTSAFAQPITVDITDGDAIDINPETGTIADLPGPDGHISFSEAMIASNNTPGRQTIGFAIPTSEWTYLPLLYPGRAVITGIMFYANAADEVTIDGTTQTAFTGDTNPNGREVMIIRGGGLYFPANNCRVTGLDQTSVRFEGSNGVVEDNSVMGIDIYGGTGSAGTGSGTLVRRNTGGGYVQIDQADNSIVVGNMLNRVRVLGHIASGRPATNNRIGGPTLAERNVIMGQGTLNSQGIPGGFAIQLSGAIGTTIENSWIGTTPDGMAPGHPYTTIGIYFDDENRDTVIRNNRIAGIRAIALPPHGPSYPVGTGIQLYGSGSGVAITGNTIGLNANGEPTLGSVTGISSVHFFYPNGVPNVVIGGSGPGEGNDIAGHLGVGISIANTYSGVRISGNSIHDNGGLGIDLVSAAFEYGLTLNDPLDSDAGGNGLQNFPVLESAVAAGTGITTITGSLSSTPRIGFTIEFFASGSCDPSGFGEGARFLGSLNVTTGATGSVAFTGLVNGSTQPGEHVTSTAMRTLAGDTSEFSACVTVTGMSCTADFNADEALNSQDLFDFLVAFFASQPASDFNADGQINSQDFFDFLAAFFAGC